MIVIIPLITTMFPGIYEIEKTSATIDEFTMKSIIFNGAKMMTNIQVLKTQREYVRQFSQDLISVELTSCRSDSTRGKLFGI